MYTNGELHFSVVCVAAAFQKTGYLSWAAEKPKNQ
jgi:hypothetical protein